MNKKILKYIFLDLIRSRFILTYTVILFLISLFINYVSDSPQKTAASLLNVVLIIIPLVSMIFSSIHYYNSKEFMEFLLTQPVARSEIFRCEYLAVSLALCFAFIAGIGSIVILSGMSGAMIYLMISGLFLTFIFTGGAFLIASLVTDKVRGIGIAILMWLYFSVMFDGFVLMIFYLFRDYPLNNFIIGLTMLNPIDLSRILILMQLDISALMGFSGATFKNFFGQFYGKIISLLLMLIWIFIPLFLSQRIFKKKNF